MPFYRCAVSPSREEEERLLYVAMTRAQTTLHFGYFCEDDHPDIPCGLSQLCVPLWPDVESAPRRMTAEEEILDNCDYDFREW